MGAMLMPNNTKTAPDTTAGLYCIASGVALNVFMLVLFGIAFADGMKSLDDAVDSFLSVGYVVVLIPSIIIFPLKASSRITLWTRREIINAFVLMISFPIYVVFVHIVGILYDIVNEKGTWTVLEFIIWAGQLIILLTTFSVLFLHAPIASYRANKNARHHEND